MISLFLKICTSNASRNIGPKDEKKFPPYKTFGHCFKRKFASRQGSLKNYLIYLELEVFSLNDSLEPLIYGVQTQHIQFLKKIRGSKVI